MAFNKCYICWGALYLLVFVASFFLSGIFVPGMQVDPSWQAVIELAAKDGLQWGKDIVFTHGPLGFLNATFSQGLLTIPRVAFAVLWGALSSWVVVSILRDLPASWRYPLLVWFLLGTTLVSFNLQHTVFLVMAWIALRLADEGRKPLAFLAAAALFALLSLIKFTFFLTGSISLVLCVMAVAARRNYWNAATLAFGYPVVFVLLWQAIGQNTGNLYAWFMGSWSISSGYSDAMALPPTSGVMPICFMSLAAFILMIFLSVPRGQYTGETMRRLCIVLLTTVIVWKQGIIRADAIHLSTFLFNLPLLAGLLTVEIRRSGLPEHRRFLRLALFAVLLAGCVLNAELLMNGTLKRMTATFPKALAWKAEMLFKIASGRGKECFDALTPGYDREDGNGLPRLKALVGTATVDENGSSQWAVIANGMNYRPRPTIQGYAAYTPELQRLDLSFFESSRRPEFLLVNMHTFDNRYPVFDDPLVFPLILANYHPAGEEMNFLLLKANSGPLITPHYELLTEKTVAFGVPFGFAEWSDQHLLLKLEIKPTVWGHLVGTAFQLPPLEMELFGEDGFSQVRFSPGMVQSGFLVNPFLGVTNDLANYYRGERKSIIGMKVIASPEAERLYTGKMKVQLFKVALDYR